MPCHHQRPSAYVHACVHVMWLSDGVPGGGGFSSVLASSPRCVNVTGGPWSCVNFFPTHYYALLRTFFCLLVCLSMHISLMMFLSLLPSPLLPVHRRPSLMLFLLVVLQVSSLLFKPAYATPSAVASNDTAANTTLSIAATANVDVDTAVLTNDTASTATATVATSGGLTTRRRAMLRTFDDSAAVLNMAVPIEGGPSGRAESTVFMDCVSYDHGRLLFQH